MIEYKASDNICPDNKLFMDTRESSVAKALENIDNWSYDTFALATATENAPLKHLAQHLFQRYDITAKFKINQLTLDAFLSRIEEGYCLKETPNPYHNSTHAADVTQTMHFMISKMGVKNSMTDLDIFASLLAAIVHDFEHTGYTNNFLVMTGSDKALIYNDISVQENHHISAAFFVLKEANFNILVNLSQDEFRKLRSLMIDMVLATDMAYHFNHLKEMNNRLSNDSRTYAAVDKPKVLSLLLHCCDISHPAKSWSLNHRWVSLLLEEFFAQGDREQELGLPISPLCDRRNTKIPESQINFIDFIVTPTMSTCADMIDFVLSSNGNGNSNEDSNDRQCYRKLWESCLAHNKTNWMAQPTKCI